MKSVKYRKVLNVLSYIFVGIAFTLSLVGIIIRFNKGTVYLFNTRADVVLSGSMSYKNEEHLDFLEGHDDQIQKFDLVFSKKVETDDDINVYDTVLYRNPMLGTTMHRIVGKNVESEETFYLQKTAFAEYDGQPAIQFTEWLSQIITSPIIYSGFEVTIISKDSNADNYRFTDGYELHPVEVTTTQIGDYYEHHVVRRDIPSKISLFVMCSSKEFDASNDYITSISIDAQYGQITATADKFTQNEEGAYTYNAQTTYVYEIRGDAVKDSDVGRFTVEDIYSKVTFVIPKAGYFIRFITSVYGLILMIGLGFIIIGAQFFLEYENKKKEILGEK